MPLTDILHIASGRPTPRIGVWERINIAAFMLWVAVFAAFLLRGPAVETGTNG